MTAIKRTLFPLVLTILGSLVADPVAFAQVSAEVAPGRPFGVASVTLPIQGNAPEKATDASFFSVVEEDGRVLYPAFASSRQLRETIGQFAPRFGNLIPRTVTVTFLFTGDDPLNVTVYSPAGRSITLTPRPLPQEVHQRLLRLWWDSYTRSAREHVRQGDYPPLVETYLTTMLAGRLGLEPPQLQKRPAEPLRTLQLLAGTESLRMATMQDTLLGINRFDEPLGLPFPNDIGWAPPVPVEHDDDVQIEPIAMHVPPECFYIRFGKFSNFLWLRHLMDEHGGDLKSMTTARGHNVNLNAQMERQLSLRNTALADLLGDQVISDVALIGRDTFLREGAAIGMLFEAKNEFLLGANLAQERAATLAREKKNGCTEETVEVAGRKVSFLSTPDNRVRSFLAGVGKYRLVTTSQAMTERFFTIADGDRSLGQTAEFRHARTRLRTSREDTIFVYLSSAFFRGLVSPQYQIELERRLKSVTDLELIQLARLAARSEGWPSDSIDDLTAGGFLPRGFGRRADGSGPIVTDDASLDSRRGARGSFLPVTDVKITQVTQSEAERYVRRATFYQDNWKQMDPLMIGIKRYALDDAGLERVVIDANVSPFGEEKYGWVTSILGPPTNLRVTTSPDDIIWLQASVRGGLLLPLIPQHHLFVGIQDNVPVTDMDPTNLLKTLQILRTTPGYLGAWPKPGFLDLLPFRLGGVADVAGYSQLPFGIWRRQFENFSVLSFDRRVLDVATTHHRAVEAENPAQIRLFVGDLSKAKLSAWVNGMNYARARQTSLGNSLLLHALTEQLHVPRRDALAIAEKLIDAKLTCPLGGEYEIVAHPDGQQFWRSTKLTAEIKDGVVAMPEDYQAHLLDWFRGAEAELTKHGDRVVLHAEIDVQRNQAAKDNNVVLPLFNLFSGSNSKNDKSKSSEPEKGENLVHPKQSTSREF